MHGIEVEAQRLVIERCGLLGNELRYHRDHVIQCFDQASRQCFVHFILADQAAGDYFPRLRDLVEGALQ